LVEIKDLYCGAFNDIPFISINDLKKGKVVETTYFSEVPFVCLSDIGGALLKALEKSHIDIEKTRVNLDKKEPMCVFQITMKVQGAEIKITTGKYVQPNRDRRPPKSENQGAFPWGYYIKLDISGHSAEVFKILSEFLINLKREPWEGLLIEEFSKETGVWEDDVKSKWLSTLQPVLDEYEKKADEAKGIKLDTKEVEMYLKDAKKALEDRKLSYLIHLINKMDFDEIDKRLKEERDKGKDISQKVLELQTIIKDAKSLELDTVTVEHYLKTAKRHMFEKKWKSAFETVTKAEEIVNALKRKSRPQLKLTLEFPDKFLVEEDNQLKLKVENTGNVPAAKIGLKASGDAKFGEMKYKEILDRDKEITIPLSITSDQGGLKNIKIELEYSREYDEKRYEVTKELELFFVDKELKMDVRSMVDYHTGYIMVDLEIVNDYIAEIQLVEIEAVINEENTAIMLIQPRCNIVENSIQLGKIPRKESAYVTIFLDPLKNEQVPIKFDINFIDPKGKKKFFIHPVEPVTPMAVRSVMGEVPSAKTLIERLASTHMHYLGKIYEIPVSLTATTCYDVLKRTAFSLPGSLVWESKAEVVKKTRGKRGKTATPTNPPEKMFESWFSIQDEEPGFSAGLHLRVSEGTDSLEFSVVGNDRHYTYSLQMRFQEAFLEELIANKYMPEDALMHQVRNLWLRQRIMGRQTEFLKMKNLDVDLDKKLEKAAKIRDDRFKAIREQELKAHKYSAWMGKKRG